MQSLRLLENSVRNPCKTWASDLVLVSLCHSNMSKQPHKKRPRDFAQRAKMIVDIATGEIEDREPTPEEQGKDPAAVSLGRRGGLKGGSARAAKLAEQRAETARKAAFTGRCG